MSDSNEKQTAFTLWIPSLAVSIVCCSVLFVVFADYLADVKESISGAQARVELLERRTNQLRLDISLMSKRLPPPPVAATRPCLMLPPRQLPLLLLMQLLRQRRRLFRQL